MKKKQNKQKTEKFIPRRKQIQRPCVISTVAICNFHSDYKTISFNQYGSMNSDFNLNHGGQT